MKIWKYSLALMLAVCSPRSLSMQGDYLEDIYVQETNKYSLGFGQTEFTETFVLFRDHISIEKLPQYLHKLCSSNPGIDSSVVRIFTDKKYASHDVFRLYLTKGPKYSDYENFKSHYIAEYDPVMSRLTYFPLLKGKEKVALLSRGWCRRNQ